MHEIELKFQIPSKSRAAVRRAVATRTAQTTRLRALYVDTPELHLARAGMALRLRQEGDRWVQTVKAPGGDALRRIEHEVELDATAIAAGPVLDLERHAQGPAAGVLAAALGQAASSLRVTFETDVLRCHRVVRSGDARVELALDVGVVRAGGAELALHEIEFELVAGGVDSLLTLARRWIERHGLWLDVRSKAERGHLLAHGLQVARATRAKPARTGNAVRDASNVGSARRRLVEAGLDHLLPNAAALAAEVAEADHLQQAGLALDSLRRAVADEAAATARPEVARAWASRLDALAAELSDTDTGWPLRVGAALRAVPTTLLWLDLLGHALVAQPAS